MSGIRSFLNPAQMAKLNRLSLQSRSVVEGTLAGRHRSAQKGASTEFADHRAYIQGDDLKRIDWKVLGRTDRYFVRRYQDETNLRVYLLVDRSASMAYTSSSKHPTKFRYAGMLAAALGYVVLKSRDSAGLVLYDEGAPTIFPCRNSFSDFDNALTTLHETTPRNKTAGAEAMHQIAESIRRRAMVIVFSDLIENTDELFQAFAHFRKQGHDVTIFHVLDPAELDLALQPATEFEDLETGEKVLCNPKAIAEEYAKVFGEFLERNRVACSDMKIDYRLCRTDVAPDTFLRSYLLGRLKR